MRYTSWMKETKHIILSWRGTPASLCMYMAKFQVFGKLTSLNYITLHFPALSSLLSRLNIQNLKSPIPDSS